MSSYQPNDTNGRGRGFRGQSRGRSNYRQTRGRGTNHGKRDSYPIVNNEQQMEGFKSHQSTTFLPQNPLTNSYQLNNISNYHHYPLPQIPSFTNPLAASINSAIRNVLPNCSSAQNSDRGSNDMFPYNPNSQNHRGGHFQSQAVQLRTPNHFSSTGVVHQNMTYQPTNLPRPMYMSNPYTPAYNMQMMPNQNYTNGYPPMGQTNYAPSQTPMYPQGMYPATQPIPSTNYLSSWQPQWIPIPQPIPRVTSEGYTISNTAIDEYGSTEHLNKKQKHNGRNSNHERHRCEPCHQDFISFPALVMHRNGHEKCSEPGCKFEGNAKSVEIHEEDRHLRFKPGKEPHAQSKRPDGPAGATIQGLGYALQTEEQITKWIEERRKRWPTSKVIAEKASKGQKSTSQGSRPSGRGDRTAGRGMPRSVRGTGHVGPRQVHNVTSQLSEKVLATNLCQKRRREDEYEEIDDDEGDEEAVLRERYLKSHSTSGIIDNAENIALHGVGDNDQVTNGVSDDDNEDMDPMKDAVSSKIEIKAPQINPTQEPNPNINHKKSVDHNDQLNQTINEKSQRVCKWWKMKRICKRGDSCLFAHPSRDQFTKKQKVSKNKVSSNTGTQLVSGSGLLSKLLEKDIKQDVADLVSVISFLVENDFLENTELEIGEERLIEPILLNHSSIQPSSLQPDLVLTDVSSEDDDFDTEDEDEDEDEDSEIEDVEDVEENGLGKVEVNVLGADSIVLDQTSVMKPVNLTHANQVTSVAH